MRVARDVRWLKVTQNSGPGTGLLVPARTAGVARARIRGRRDGDQRCGNTGWPESRIFSAVSYVSVNEKVNRVSITTYNLVGDEGAYGSFGQLR